MQLLREMQDKLVVSIHVYRNVFTGEMTTRVEHVGHSDNCSP